MEEVNLTYKVFWRVIDYPHLKITKCKKVINSKTHKMLTYNVRGFFIGDKYIKRTDLNNYIERIPKTEALPF